MVAQACPGELNLNISIQANMVSQNAFLELAHSDPYLALSFDRLHAFHSGMFGHHLWNEFKRLVEALSNDDVKLVDSQ